jgi:hypothetical protein
MSTLTSSCPAASSVRRGPAIRLRGVSSLLRRHSHWRCGLADRVPQGIRGLVIQSASPSRPAEQTPRSPILINVDGSRISVRMVASQRSPRTVAHSRHGPAGLVVPGAVSNRHRQQRGVDAQPSARMPIKTQPIIIPSLAMLRAKRPRQQGGCWLGLSDGTKCKRRHLEWPRLQFSIQARKY